MLLPRDGQEREQGGNGGYNDRNEGWEDRRGGSGGHQQSLLRPNYLGGSNDNTSFSPGRPALMAPGAMKVMGGAGITENLDRPNMPVTTITLPSFLSITHSQNLITLGSPASAGAVGGAIEPAFKEGRRSGRADQVRDSSLEV